MGNISNIRLWEDAWVASDLFFKDHVLQLTVTSSNIQLVFDLFNFAGTWNSNLINSFFPQPILDKIHVIPPLSLPVPIADSCLWEETNFRLFTISSMYGYLNRNSDVVSSFY